MQVAIVVGVALFMIGIGGFGLVSPPGLALFVARWESRRGLWTAAVFRIGFGLILGGIAPATRTPLAFQILAALTVCAGLALPWLGLVRFKRILAGWRGLPPGWIRLWAVFPVGLGIFLLWSVLA